MRIWKLRETSATPNYRLNLEFQ